MASLLKTAACSISESKPSLLNPSDSWGHICSLHPLEQGIFYIWWILPNGFNSLQQLVHIVCVVTAKIHWSLISPARSSLFLKVTASCLFNTKEYMALKLKKSAGKRFYLHPPYVHERSCSANCIYIHLRYSCIPWTRKQMVKEIISENILHFKYITYNINYDILD